MAIFLSPGIWGGPEFATPSPGLIRISPDILSERLLKSVKDEQLGWVWEEGERKKRDKFENHKFILFFQLNLFILFIKSESFIYYNI